jgi:hypothetical protein
MPTRLQEAAYARDPLGGLMRRPARLAGGCGQERPHALLTEPFYMLALYANALLCAVEIPVIQSVTGCRTLKSSKPFLHIHSINIVK